MTKLIVNTVLLAGFCLALGFSAFAETKITNDLPDAAKNQPNFCGMTQSWFTAVKSFKNKENGKSFKDNLDKFLKTPSSEVNCSGVKVDMNLLRAFYGETPNPVWYEVAYNWYGTDWGVKEWNRMEESDHRLLHRMKALRALILKVTRNTTLEFSDYWSLPLQLTLSQQTVENDPYKLGIKLKYSQHADQYDDLEILLTDALLRLIRDYGPRYDVDGVSFETIAKGRRSRDIDYGSIGYMQFNPGFDPEYRGTQEALDVIKKEISRLVSFGGMEETKDLPSKRSDFVDKILPNFKIPFYAEKLENLIRVQGPSDAVRDNRSRQADEVYCTRYVRKAETNKRQFEVYDLVEDIRDEYDISRVEVEARHFRGEFLFSEVTCIANNDYFRDQDSSRQKYYRILEDIQWKLFVLGYTEKPLQNSGGAEWGSSDSEIRRAVREIQRDADLKIDGLLGNQTILAINQMVANNGYSIFGRTSEPLRPSQDVQLSRDLRVLKSLPLDMPCRRIELHYMVDQGVGRSGVPARLKYFWGPESGSTGKCQVARTAGDHLPFVMEVELQGDLLASKAVLNITAIKEVGFADVDKRRLLPYISLVSQGAPLDIVESLTTDSYSFGDLVIDVAGRVLGAKFNGGNEHEELMEHRVESGNPWDQPSHSSLVVPVYVIPHFSTISFETFGY